LIDNDAVLASSSDENIMYEGKSASIDELLEQVQRFNGDVFVQNQIDGKGIRIAVFDGGFPGVDEHRAFAHLRGNNQILKTWNFPAGKEDVYGWNSHGTMVLSCIAGMENGKKMGLATGSEFLLARTEVVLNRPKKRCGGCKQ
jgi:subtilisin family serine protease